MKKIAVIVAGGSGLRMGTDTPKQFLLLKDKPILWHTINSFLNAYKDLKCIVVLPKEHITIGESIKLSFGNSANRIFLIVGGSSRFHSVKNGLQLVDENAIVFVHDGVRCLVSDSLIKRCYNKCLEMGSAIPVVAATDSIRLLENNQHKIADRNKVMIVQTPQTFQSHILLEAFNQPYQESFTDEATVVETLGKKVYLCEGDYNNIKITRPIDLLLAENLMNQ